MEKMSPGQIGADIQKFFPHFNSDKQKNDKAKFKGAFQNRDGLMVYAGESALFHDLCQIGALLTGEVEAEEPLVVTDDAVERRDAAVLEVGGTGGERA